MPQTTPPHSPSNQKLLREVLFSPGNIAGRENCYDRFELLRKSELNPIMTGEAPWEESGVTWGSVIRSEVDGKFKFFYGVAFAGAQKDAIIVDNAEQGSNHCVVCYAESEDGLNWTRPALNRHFQDQFPNNNIVFEWASYYNDSNSVIEDMSEPNLQRRYKMMIFHIDTENDDLHGNCLFVSPDGMDWTFTGTILPSQDASTLWQDKNTGHYYAFLKDRIGSNRSRMLMHSADFKNWSEPQWMFIPDHGDHAGTNFYSNSAFSMGGRTLGFLNLYDLTTQTTWIELVESGDNINWSRMPSRVHLLEPGVPGSYDSGGTYVGLAEPILIGDDYRFYYYARPIRHDFSDVADTNEQLSSLCFATFKKNRLVGQQTEHEGYFSTLPFVCPGGRLSLNFRSKGEVRVSIQRPGYSKDFEDYVLDKCTAVTGDALDQKIVWKDQSDLESLKGKYIRLKIAGPNLMAYSASFEAMG